MATVTTPAPETVVVRPTHVRLARWATFWLIVFMVVITVSPFFTFSLDPDGSITAFVKEWLFIPFGIYLAIQFHETGKRSSTDQAGFFKDNSLAFLALVVGVVAFVLLFFRPGYTLTPDQIHILLQCMVWDSIDFAYGIYISQRIAFAGKEREETVR